MKLCKSLDTERLKAFSIVDAICSFERKMLPIYYVIKLGLVTLMAGPFLWAETSGGICEVNRPTKALNLTPSRALQNGIHFCPFRVWELDV